MTSLEAKRAPCFWLVGVGGVGSVIVAKMSPRSLLLVDSWEANVQAIRRQGLRVDYPDATLTLKARSTTLAELPSESSAPDFVLLAVKSYETSAAVAAFEAHLGEDSAVISLQNGMNEEWIAARLGSDRTIGATCMLDGRLIAPGHAVQVKPKSRIVIGELSGQCSGRIKQIARVLSPAADITVSADIWAELWTKLVRNCMINAVSAVTNLPMGRLIKDKKLVRLCVQLGMETAQVASEVGVQLVDEDLFGGAASLYLDTQTDVVANAYRAAYAPYMSLRPSMLQDLDNGRPTEIDYINGYVVRKGTELGVTLPLNRKIVELVHNREQGALPLTPRTLDVEMASVR